MVKLLCRSLTLLIVAAYIGAATLAPIIYADTPDRARGAMRMTDDGQDGKMPCKGMAHGCVTDFGCIFLVAAPTPNVSLFTATAWLPVRYDNPSDALHGRTIEPALGPPISVV
jgi:hypothetical protein